MFVDINLVKYGEPFRLEEEITDIARIADLLGLEPKGPFKAVADCVLEDEGLNVKLQVSGVCHARCDRCGEATTAKCYCTFTEDLTEGDPEFDYVAEKYVLDSLINECIVLSAPREALCKQDCKGLCPVCGTNLNYNSCSCKNTLPEKVNPFGALQDIFLTGGAKNGSTKK